MLDLITVCIAIVTFILTCAHLATRRPSNMPPGPFVWPIVGNLFDFSQSHKLHLKADELYKKYGPIVSLQMAGYPTVLISDVKLMRELLVDKANQISNRPNWLPFFEFAFRKETDHGFGMSNGATWKRRKGIFQQSFGKLGYNSRKLEEKVQEEARELINEMKKSVGNDFHFGRLLNKATANVILLITLGERLQYTDKEFEHFLQSTESAMNQISNRNPFKYLPGACCFLIPVLHPKLFITILRMLEWVNKIIKTSVIAHRKTFDENDFRDFVDICLQGGFDDEEICGILKDVLSAGSDPIATTLLFAVILMAKHPDVQEKCKAEIMRAVGTDRMLAVSDKKQLPYVSATILEIQRITAVAALGGPGVYCSESVDVGIYTLPKNTIIIWNQYSAHYDPKYWENPQEFQPERFLSEDKQSTIKPESFIPFGVGPRACPGENLSNMELFLFFSSLIANFRFSTSDKDSLPTINTVNYTTLLLQPGDFSVSVEIVK